MTNRPIEPLIGRLPPPAPPPPPATTTLPPQVQLVQNGLALAASGAIITQWDKLAAWVVAGFAAALALIMSHYQETIAMTSPGTVKAVLRMFVAVSILHIVQRLLGTMVQAGVAAKSESEKVKLPELSMDQARLLLEGLARNVWWPMRFFVRRSYAKMMDGDISHFGKYLMWAAQGSLVSALLQVLIAIWAIVRVWRSLHG